MLRSDQRATGPYEHCYPRRIPSGEVFHILDSCAVMALDLLFISAVASFHLEWPVWRLLINQA